MWPLKCCPLSFAEYIRFTGDEHDLARKYRAYLETSSFPYVTELAGDPKAIEEYLSGIYHTVVLKDVVGRMKTADPMILESILRFVYSSIGSPISTKKIADTLTSQGRKQDVRTVERYLDAFLGSYIVYQAKRYDIRGKQHLKTLEKYYAVDMGLRFFLLGRAHADAGHLLGNVVYLELLRRGYRFSLESWMNTRWILLPFISRVSCMCRLQPRSGMKPPCSGNCVPCRKSATTIRKSY